VHVVADTGKLVEDGIITATQAATIEDRAREIMLYGAINTVLTFGIIAATAGLVFWLASAVAVAVTGALATLVGVAILMRGGAMFAIFGNASALIGTGMLIGGATIEVIERYEDAAPATMMLMGAALLLAAGQHLLRRPGAYRFLAGTLLVMGLGTHLFGLGLMLLQAKLAGFPVSLFYFYASAMLFASGWLIDIRFVTALAIVPFAQMLDTGTFYFGATYVFYSPEPSLSIVQMSVLIVLAYLLAARIGERHARHFRVLAMLAFVVANLCALVGSLWGDVIGKTLWGPGGSGDYADSAAHAAAEAAFEASAMHLSSGFYAVVWAVVLVGLIFLAAHRTNRGLFNGALTFAGIHAYPQLFEHFAREPLAYVIGGLAAVPLAWGMWWLNARMAHQAVKQGGRGEGR